MKIKVGKNNIPYSQDFGFYRQIPQGIGRPSLPPEKAILNLPSRSRGPSIELRVEMTRNSHSYLTVAALRQAPKNPRCSGQHAGSSFAGSLSLRRNLCRGSLVGRVFPLSEKQGRTCKGLHRFLRSPGYLIGELTIHDEDRCRFPS